MCSRGARGRERGLAESPEIPADPTVAETVLFKPSDFMPRLHMTLASALSSKRSVMKVRLKSRRNLWQPNCPPESFWRSCLVTLNSSSSLCPPKHLLTEETAEGTCTVWKVTLRIRSYYRALSRASSW
ncbi:hypothetical protein MRX96_010916 [Rhipicephalus microplus]